MHTKDLYATGQLCSSDLFSAMLGPAMLVSMTAQNTGTKGFFESFVSPPLQACCEGCGYVGLSGLCNKTLKYYRKYVLYPLDKAELENLQKEKKYTLSPCKGNRERGC